MKKGGKNNKRKKRTGGEENLIKELILKGENQQYGKIIKMLGNSRVSCKCYGKMGIQNRLAIIPGKFRKRVWINPDDIVLLGIREFQDDKADIIYKYTPNEAKQLIRKGEIPNEEQVDGQSLDSNEVSIQFGGLEEKMEKKEQVQKPKKFKEKTGEYLDKDFLPPSDSDSEEDSEGNAIVKPNIKRLNNFKMPDEDDLDADEIDLEDL